METGLKCEIERKVTEDMTALKIGSGQLEVLATPALIALAEECAWRSVSDELDEGCQTVGTAMNLSHIAASPVGMKITCEAELVEIDRRKLVFKINAFDEKEKIAEGVHERFIIKSEGFMEKAKKKMDS